MTQRSRAVHRPALDFLRYIGPGMIVAVGFIDPGNWSANLAAGSQWGYKLLWVVTFSTLILGYLQHNAAHLGIVTGECLSENIARHMNAVVGKFVLVTAMLAAISTAVAEVLGCALALQMLFHLPLQIGAILSGGLVVWLLLSNSYRRIEKVILALVSLVGISFVIELFRAPVDWHAASVSLFVPSLPSGSIIVIMSVLGAVVMPTNLFLHSEIIQSRQWNLADEKVIQRQLKFEFTDTIFSLSVGWVINCAIIVLAAASFFGKGTIVSELSQAQVMLAPLLGSAAAVIFALALLLTGIAASLTAGMAGGSILAGAFREPYDIGDAHSKAGVLATVIPAVLIVCFVTSPFNVLVFSQMLLGVQLPFTIASQIYLTASGKVMGKYKNTRTMNVMLVLIGVFVTGLNLVLLVGV